MVNTFAELWYSNSRNLEPGKWWFEARGLETFGMILSFLSFKGRVWFFWMGRGGRNESYVFNTLFWVCLFTGLGWFFGGMKLTYFSSRQDDKKLTCWDNSKHDLPLTDSSFIFPRKNCTTPTICVFAETTPTIEFFVLPAQLLGLADVGGGSFLRWRKTWKKPCWRTWRRTPFDQCVGRHVQVAS